MTTLVVLTLEELMTSPGRGLHTQPWHETVVKASHQQGLINQTMRGSPGQQGSGWRSLLPLPGRVSLSSGVLARSLRTAPSRRCQVNVKTSGIGPAGWVWGMSVRLVIEKHRRKHSLRSGCDPS